MGAYIGIGGKAKKIQKGYIGVPTRIPIYETTGEKVTITVDNIGDYFNVTNSTYYFAGSSGTWTSNNKAVNSSTAQTVLTLKSDGKVSFNYTCSSESNYDKLTITTTIGGTTTTRVNAVSGVKSGSLSYDMSAGDSITFKYVKDSSANSNSDICTFSNLVHDTFQEFISGYEIKGRAKKIKKIYAEESGKAKLVYAEKFTVSLSENKTFMPVARYYFNKTNTKDYEIISGGSTDNGSGNWSGSDTTYVIRKPDATISTAPVLSCVIAMQGVSSTPDGERAFFFGGSSYSAGWYLKRAETYTNELMKTVLASLSQGRSYGSGESNSNYTIIAGGLIEYTIGSTTPATVTASVEGFNNSDLTKLSSISPINSVSNSLNQNAPECIRIEDDIIVCTSSPCKYDKDLTKTNIELGNIGYLSTASGHREMRRKDGSVSFLSKSGTLCNISSDCTLSVSNVPNIVSNVINNSIVSTIVPTNDIFIHYATYNTENGDVIKGICAFEDGITYTGFERIDDIVANPFVLFRMSENEVILFNGTTTSSFLEIS